MRTNRQPPSQVRQPEHVPNISTGSQPTSYTPGTEPADTYTVREGDTLAKIAKRVFGDPAKWERIYDVNRDLVHDPDHLEPGLTLRIP